VRNRITRRPYALSSFVNPSY
jgi:hypothetical protein